MRGLKHLRAMALFTACLAAGPLCAAQAVEPGGRADSAADLLMSADTAKAVDVASFNRSMTRLAPMVPQFDDSQRAMWHYLRGWRATWVGDYATGQRELTLAA